MTVLEQISNPYFASLVLGLLYGLTFCTSVCLPYVISYIAGIGAGFRKGIMVTTIYNSGRIAAYAIMGTAISLLLFLGGATSWLLNKAPLFKKWVTKIGGLVLAVLGLGVLVNSLLTIGTWK